MEKDGVGKCCILSVESIDTAQDLLQLCFILGLEVRIYDKYCHEFYLAYS